MPVRGKDELADLALSFNRMAGELSATREAERAFLMSVSHELKTPLTAIRGYAEALQEGTVEPAEAASTIHAEATRLERLVRDLLDLARLDRRKFSVAREAVDLAAVAERARARWVQHAREMGVELDVSAAPAGHVSADAERLLQVVSNLVENALRSTPAGGRVTIALGPGYLIVRDTGLGLDPEDLPRAFDRFFLHSKYGSDREVGSGLGLAIVKELVEAMDGQVEVASEPGRGTAFTVRLPPAAHDGDGGEAPRPPAARSSVGQSRSRRPTPL